MQSQAKQPSNQADAAPASGWASKLDLRYASTQGRCSGHSEHRGALRVLAALYPEGPGVCHHVLVHPPGGLVGGDRIDINLQLEAQAHALVTTPGATRFYRSLGQAAVQQVQAHVHAGARLEWLPLETLAYDSCLAENRAMFTLQPGAEMMGWDMLALGLPAAGKPLRQGHIVQHLELPGVWLERGRLAATDEALLHSPGGLRGHSAMGTLFFAAGSPIAATRRDALLEAARHLARAHQDLLVSGATSPRSQVVVLRVLGKRIEPITTLLRAVWSAWRPLAWAIPPCPPRVWST
jgi:urease accessory protein